ncbi:hypothetical protein KSP39_PZI016028 [Platanthera zijinensis]|uniref:Uncharacterized protein n=1 Tax=Platanthera zijinensis TaxID=2320716 RepID=A0AAP0G1T4_9ASPA
MERGVGAMSLIHGLLHRFPSYSLTHPKLNGVCCGCLGKLFCTTFIDFSITFNVISLDYSLSSVRAQLDLLEQLTSSTNIGEGYESDDDTTRRTIREQLIELTRGRDGDFALQLGKKMKQSLKNLNILTVSQRRNIKRQTYLNEVAGRNDLAFFSTVGAFVILPPVVILAVAIQIGYVQLFP